jgi:hypothetical protein
MDLKEKKGKRSMTLHYEWVDALKWNHIWPVTVAASALLGMLRDISTQIQSRVLLWAWILVVELYRTCCVESQGVDITVPFMLAGLLFPAASTHAFVFVVDCGVPALTSKYRALATSAAASVVRLL